MSMMPRAYGLRPGAARLARRGAALGACVALLAAGCGPAGPGARGRSGTSAALAGGHWSVLTASPLGNRQDPVVSWTGRELLEIGGWGGHAGSRDGAAFDPATGRWRRIAPAPVPVGALAASVWTGRSLFVFGGQLPGGATAGLAAAVYAPASGRWTLTSPAPFGQGLSQPTAVWTGRLVVVAGTAGGRVETAAYDPADGRWWRLDPPLPAAHPAINIAMVAAAGRVVLWSEWGQAQQASPGSYTGYSGVDVRALAGGRWQDVTASWPQHQTVPAPLFTGSKILVPPGQPWCGPCPGQPAGGLPGFLADPFTLRVTQLPRGPLDDTSPVMVWTGAVALAINTGTEIGAPVNVRPGDMAAFDPASRTWRRLPGAPAALQGDTVPAWTGRELLAIAAGGALLSFAPRKSG